MIPPNSQRAQLGFIWFGSNGAPTTFGLRKTGSQATNVLLAMFVTGGSASDATISEAVLDSSQQLDYITGGSAPLSGGFFIDVFGYELKNGGD